MASIVITLPTGLVFNVTVPNGGQRIPIAIRECACGCHRWFPVLPNEPAKIYSSEECQQRAHNDRRRKTEQRRKR